MQDGMNVGILEGICPAVPRGAVDGALCFVATWELPILAGLLVLAGLAVFFWMRRRGQGEDDVPMLVFPIRASEAMPAPREPQLRVAAPVAAAPEAVAPEAAAPAEPDVAPEVASPEPEASDADAVRDGAAPPLADGEGEAPPKAAGRKPKRAPKEVSPDDAEADPGERMVLRVGPSPTPSTDGEGAQAASNGPGRKRKGPDDVVRFQAPPDGTLQLLPGRLEIEKGPGQGREIRFVRVPGRPAEVSFGRAEGPDFLHVQLDSPTVSRQHARMRFRDGTWFLRNQSGTNPTRVGGRTLGEAEVPLSDGSRVEIGEITFRFRQEGGQDRIPYRSSFYTDRGRRASNQDAVLVRTLPDGREVVAVCDGMGSHHAGGIASHRALEALVAALSKGGELEFAVRTAHEAVLEAAGEVPDREGMGTTMVALLRKGDVYELANVGDSRAYRIDASGISQLTRDHSFMAEATEEGGLSAEEAARSPWRNAVTRNLGSDRPLEVDLFTGFSAGEPHRVILCTDGVHNVLGDAEIARISSETVDVRDLARALSEAALVHGGEDNVAVAALAFAGAPREEGDEGTGGVEGASRDAEEDSRDAEEDSGDGEEGAGDAEAGAGSANAAAGDG